MARVAQPKIGWVSFRAMPVTDAEARRFVAGCYGRRAAGVRALGAGEWSRAYAFVLGGREMVIRFGDHVEDFRKDQVMAAYSCAALPIPAVIEIGAVGDGYFAVSERAPGELLDGLDSAGMGAALPGLLAALDALRGVDVSSTRGYGIRAPDRDGPAASWAQALLAISQETARVPGWRATLAASPVGSGPFDRGYDRLRELAEAGSRSGTHVVYPVGLSFAPGGLARLDPPIAVGADSPRRVTEMIRPVADAVIVSGGVHAFRSRHCPGLGIGLGVDPVCHVFSSVLRSWRDLSMERSRPLWIALLAGEPSGRKGGQ